MEIFFNHIWSVHVFVLGYVTEKANFENLCHCCVSIAIMAFAASPLAIFLRTVEQMPAETIKTDEENDLANKPVAIKHDNSETSSEVEAEKQEVIEISNQPQTIKATLKEAFTSVTFLLITLGFTVCGFHVAFIATHLPAYLQGYGIDSSISGKSRSECLCQPVAIYLNLEMRFSLVCFYPRVWILYRNNHYGLALHQVPIKTSLDSFVSFEGRHVSHLFLGSNFVDNHFRIFRSVWCK